MIRSVRIRGFKRLHEAEFHFTGNVVLTGPNDTGKTTLLQAIASWARAHCDGLARLHLSLNEARNQGRLAATWTMRFSSRR